MLEQGGDFLEMDNIGCSVIKYFVIKGLTPAVTKMSWIQHRDTLHRRFHQQRNELLNFNVLFCLFMISNAQVAQNLYNRQKR